MIVSEKEKERKIEREIQRERRQKRDREKEGRKRDKEKGRNLKKDRKIFCLENRDEPISYEREKGLKCVKIAKEK